jgi:hypothetical protein
MASVSGRLFLRRVLDRNLEVVRLPLELTLASMDFRRDPGACRLPVDFNRVAGLRRHRAQERFNARHSARIVNEGGPADRHDGCFYSLGTGGAP